MPCMKRVQNEENKFYHICSLLKKIYYFKEQTNSSSDDTKNKTSATECLTQVIICAGESDFFDVITCVFKISHKPLD